MGNCSTVKDWSCPSICEADVVVSAQRSTSTQWETVLPGRIGDVPLDARQMLWFQYNGAAAHNGKLFYWEGLEVSL
jgi:phage baseplate assembly protein gpV